MWRMNVEREVGEQNIVEGIGIFERRRIKCCQGCRNKTCEVKRGGTCV